MNPILLKLDKKTTLLGYLKQDFIQFNDLDNTFSPHYSEILQAIEKEFKSLPSKYSDNFELVYCYLDAIEYCKKVLKFPSFHQLNIIENFKMSVFSFHHSRCGDKECLNIHPFITDSKSTRKLIYSSNQFEVYLMLSDNLYLNTINDLIPILLSWHELKRVAEVLGKPYFKFIVQRYLEFCFKEFVGFTHIDFLSSYGKEGIFDINSYLINMVIGELGNPKKFEIEDCSPMTVEAYKQFLEMNNLNRSLWSDVLIFKKFYRFIEEDLYLIEAAENHDRKNTY